MRTSVLAGVSMALIVATEAPRAWSAETGSGDDLYLARQGAPAASIVIAARAPQDIRALASELQEIVHAASGATLPVIADNQPLEPGRSLILIGPSAHTKALGLPDRPLGIEEFLVERRGNALVFLGGPGPGKGPTNALGMSTVTAWAVYAFLADEVGVRWLWPGPDGTYVPRSATLAAKGVKWRRKPEMELRFIRAKKLNRRSGALAVDDSAETKRWMVHHFIGNRSEVPFGHAFVQWGRKYGGRPELFAQPPPGTRPRIPLSRLQLRIGNEAVDETIIAEWTAAGRPRYWNVSPNDARGFCTAPESRALDAPNDYNPEDIWQGKVDLAPRYVRAWRRLHEKMAKLRPDVALATYAYSAYRDPPPARLGLRFERETHAQLVHNVQAYEAWDGWRRLGARLYLRPNWLLAGAGTPYLDLAASGAYFKYAATNGMQGFDFDSLTDSWALQGIRYYLIARLSEHPEFSVEQVVDEYAAAFGPARHAVAEYVNYWERDTQRVGLPLDAKAEAPSGGRYARCTQGGVPLGRMTSRVYKIRKCLYPADLLDGGRAILLKAKDAAKADAQALRRVEFLLRGLDEFARSGEPISPEW